MLRQAWGADGQIPVWVGGNSEAAIRRVRQVRRRLAPAERHPALPARCGGKPLAAGARAAHQLCRLTGSPVGDAERLAGTGSLEQILDDLDELRRLGADTVVLDPYHGDPEETRRPDDRLAGAHRRGHPLEDSIVITPADQTLLRRAIAIAAHAITLGDAPYGSLLADADGAILIEAHNTVRRDNDIAAHPELKLARWAARELGPDVGRADHHVHQRPGLSDVRRRHRALRARPGRVRPVHRAVRQAQPGVGRARGGAGGASAA